MWRRLAVAWGYLPDGDIDYLAMSETDRRGYHQASPGCNEFLEAAFLERANGELVVKGAGDEPFPRHAPPRHKYAALFDPRPCFDGIRVAFLRASRQAGEGRGRAMFEALDRDAAHVDPALLEKALDLAAKLMEDQKR